MTETEFHDHLVATYATALRSSHGGARVQIHVSTDVAERMKAMATIKDDTLPDIRTCWNYPVVVEEKLPQGTFQVHTVQTVIA